MISHAKEDEKTRSDQNQNLNIFRKREILYKWMRRERESKLWIKEGERIRFSC